MLRSKVEVEKDKLGESITNSPTQNLVQAYLSSKFRTENITTGSMYFVPDLIKAILEVLSENSKTTDSISPSNDFHTRLSQKLNLNKPIGGQFEKS